jgi:hypothetical protein
MLSEGVDFPEGEVSDGDEGVLYGMSVLCFYAISLRRRGASFPSPEPSYVSVLHGGQPRLYNFFRFPGTWEFWHADLVLPGY